MTGYTVAWHAAARDELVRIWLAAPDRNADTEAAYRIDQLLAADPDRKGQEFFGILVATPLAVFLCETFAPSRLCVRSVGWQTWLRPEPRWVIRGCRVRESITAPTSRQ